ncbi:hypothetical protein GCM10011494_31390 [Novosphingobium endophyticum]|uniref:Uncharacterized protein n=1 Tax=Novosphingobium endophyticum TaxID=1955250 RepID=A0A916TV41_9SPHN|nr:hypothetical protein GCM10011494_31390 [Novosphingobium endophyticum]
MPITGCPRDISASATAAPMKPAAPVTMIVWDFETMPAPIKVFAVASCGELPDAVYQVIAISPESAAAPYPGTAPLRQN